MTIRIMSLAAAGVLGLWAGTASAQMSTGALSIEVTPGCLYQQSGAGLIVVQGDPIACGVAVAPGLASTVVVATVTRPLPSISAPSALEQQMASGVPASNPVGLVPWPTGTQPGWEPTYEDGRINPFRGVPRIVSGQALVGVAP